LASGVTTRLYGRGCATGGVAPPGKPPRPGVAVSDPGVDGGGAPRPAFVGKVTGAGAGAAAGLLVQAAAPATEAITAIRILIVTGIREEGRLEPGVRTQPAQLQRMLKAACVCQSIQRARSMFPGVSRRRVQPAAASRTVRLVVVSLMNAERHSVRVRSYAALEPSAITIELRILSNSPGAYTGCTTRLGLIGWPSNWSPRYRGKKCMCKCGIEFP
jgi:hypothetical protein